MRNLILHRIEEIKNNEGGFPKSTMRWDNFSTGIDKRHISEIKFEESLVLLFERLIRRVNIQM